MSGTENALADDGVRVQEQHGVAAAVVQPLVDGRREPAVRLVHQHPDGLVALGDRFRSVGAFVQDDDELVGKTNRFETGLELFFFIVGDDERREAGNGHLYQFRRFGEPVNAMLAGNVFKVLVHAGEQVSEGQALVVIEAMKMETQISAPHTGTVAEVHVQEGDTVAVGDTLITIA